MRYSTLYYLLFVLMIFGAFASMAQNDYGLRVLGGVSFAFALLFIIQFIRSVSSKTDKNSFNGLEFFCLSVISIILTMRTFYLHVSLVEIVFGLAGILLLGIYSWKMVTNFNALRNKNLRLTIIVSLAYCSIVLYILSMTTVPFLPSLARPCGITAFLMLIASGVIAFATGPVLLDGERISGIQFMAAQKDRSVLLLSLFLAFTMYTGFTGTGWIPKMYSDEFPQSYFELVTQAESGKETPVNGKYKHEEFKEAYERFIDRNSQSNK